MNTLSTREMAMKAILETARKDERLVIVSPDAMLAARAVPFQKEFPNRLIEVGIAEQCAVDMAAGLASVGMKPIVITYAGFLTMRACEMMRTFVAYPQANVKFIGLNGGMLGGEREGVTHQFYEDLGILRSMPGITILTPADGNQAYQATLDMLGREGPAYLRLASGREPQVFEAPAPLPQGGVERLTDYGSDVAIFASGYVMDRALEAAKALKDRAVGASVINVTTLKPLDEAAVAAELARTGCAVTVEDHNIYGALGSAICEVACAWHPCKVVRLGLGDLYPRSGPAAALLDAYGLAVGDIVKAAYEAMEGKRREGPGGGGQ